MTPRPALFFLLFIAATQAQDLNDLQQTFRGITVLSVQVVMEEPCKAILDVNSIRTDVELRLRSAGISVTRNGGLEDDGADVWVATSCMEIASQGRKNLGWAVHYEVYVRQDVLIRRTQYRTTATTWRRGGLGVGGTEIQETARRDIRDAVDQLLNDYLSANPKK